MKKSILIISLRCVQVVARREINQTFKSAVIDLHYNEPAVRRPVSVAPHAADSESVPFDCQLEVLTPHPGQFNFYHKAGVRKVNVRVRRPAGLRSMLTVQPRNGLTTELNCGTDLVHTSSNAHRLIHRLLNFKCVYPTRNVQSEVPSFRALRTTACLVPLRGTAHTEQNRYVRPAVLGTTRRRNSSIAVTNTIPHAATCCQSMA